MIPAYTVADFGLITVNVGKVKTPHDVITSIPYKHQVGSLGHSQNQLGKHVRERLRVEIGSRSGRNPRFKPAFVPTFKIKKGLAVFQSKEFQVSFPSLVKSFLQRPFLRPFLRRFGPTAQEPSPTPDVLNVLPRSEPRGLRRSFVPQPSSRSLSQPAQLLREDFLRPPTPADTRSPQRRPPPPRGARR